MKRLIFILYLISFLLISWSAFSQAVTQTGFVGKFSFQSFSAGGSSDVTGTLDAFSDQTNQYFANNIQVGDLIWDNQGGRWEVMAVNSSNLLQADVDLRSVNGAGGTPFGVGFVSRETPNMGLSLFVPDNNIGISQQLKSRIESHNMLLIDQYVEANQDSVFTGATAADTSTVSDPTIGDVLVADNGDVGYYDGSSWVINSGGGPDNLGNHIATQPVELINGTEGAPALTIDGDEDTGVWSREGDDISISTGGTERFRIDGDDIYLFPGILYDGEDLYIGTDDDTTEYVEIEEDVVSVNDYDGDFDNSWSSLYPNRLWISSKANGTPSLELDYSMDEAFFNLTNAPNIEFGRKAFSGFSLRDVPDDAILGRITFETRAKNLTIDALTIQGTSGTSTTGPSGAYGDLKISANDESKALITIEGLTGNFDFEGNNIVDANGDVGTSGQVLSSLGSGNGLDWIDAGGGGSDGNGIYSGSGTVPDSTLADLTDTFVFLGESGVSGEVDMIPIGITADLTVGKQTFAPGIMNMADGFFIPDTVASWGWKNLYDGPFGFALNEFWINPMSGVYGRYEMDEIGTGIHQDNAIGSFKFLNNSNGDSLYYHLGPSGMEQSYYDNGDSTKFEFGFSIVDLDFQDGNNRFVLTRDANISLAANTGFTATTTSGILGLTHTGSSGQLIIQSQDERATFQGEEARIIGDTLARMTVGSGQSLIKDALVDLTAGSSDFATLDGSINEFRVGTHDIVFEGTDGFYPEWKFETPVAANDWRMWTGGVGLTLQNGAGENTIVIANGADPALSVAADGDLRGVQYDNARHDTDNVQGNYSVGDNGDFLKTFDGEFNFRDDADATSTNTSTIIMNNASMQLPSALTNAGKIFIVIANSSTSGGSTRDITVAGGGTIEGNASLTMDNAYEVYALVSNGTEYIILWNKP